MDENFIESQENFYDSLEDDTTSSMANNRENYFNDDDDFDQENQIFRPIKSSAFTVNLKSPNNFGNGGDGDQSYSIDTFLNPFPMNDGLQSVKLPPRLAARLQKQQQRGKVKVLGNLENAQPSSILHENPLIRRETIVVRSKKDNNSFNQNATILFMKENNLKNQTVNLDNCKFGMHENDDQKYVDWINSVIAISFKIENITVDTARIINECVMAESVNMKNKRLQEFSAKKAVNVPLKDGITSIAYREEKLMDMLRSKASQLYHSNELKLVKEVLSEDLQIPRYYIRKDRSIHMDVGSKKHILEILLNYNPLWLKVALETVFEHKISNSGKNEVHTLVQFLTKRLLSFKEVALGKNFKNVTTYFMNENNVILAKRHILFHFLMIVHFLDVAKQKRLIDHDPCLFKTDAQCKSSRDIVLSFARDYITGVGDVTKSLRNAGILLTYVQNPIEEFNFTVTKLVSDLRCGIRLARLSEIILFRNDILPRLYFPPNNITRKMHNIELVLQVLKPLIGDLSKTLTPKDIVIGVRPKTIVLLDRLIEVYNMRQREIELQQSIEFIIKIQRFFRRHKQCRKEREEFLKLRKTAVFIQRKWRSLRELKKIIKAAIIIQRRYRARNEMIKCLKEYHSMRQSAIKIQQKYRSLMLTRQYRQEFLKQKSSAILIQKIWRGYYQRKQFLELKQSTLIIQRRFRAKREMIRCQQHYQLMRQSAITIQRKYRSLLLTRQYRQEFLKQKSSAILIQKVWRGYYQRKKFLELKQSALVIQQRFRANREMIQCRKRYKLMRQSAIRIQQVYRSYVLTCKIRKEFLKQKSAAILIQKVWRGYYQRKQFLKLKQSTIVIQRRYRAKREMIKCQQHYKLMRQSAIRIQQVYRSFQLTRQYRKEFLKQKSSAILIQKIWRGYYQRKNFLELKQNTLIIQRRFRAKREMIQCQQHYKLMRQSAIKVQQVYRSLQLTRQYRKEFLKQKYSAILIQKIWRGYYQRKKFLELKQSTLVIQRRFRAKREMIRCKQNYKLMQQSAIKIQQVYRSYILKKHDRNKFLLMKQSTILIQKIWRGHHQRKLFLKQRESVLVIQRYFRCQKLMKEQRDYYLKLKQATILIQKRYRAIQIGRPIRNRFLEMKNSAILIQRYYRNWKRGNRFKIIVNQYINLVQKSSIIIQKTFRGYRTRKQLEEKWPILTIRRQRSNYLRENLLEQDKLINVMSQIIQRMTQNYSLNQLSKDIERIDKATTYSIEICKYLVEHQWFIQILLLAFDELNRSEPHKKIISHILMVFLNILKKTECRFLYCNLDILNILIKFIKNHSKSNNIIRPTLKLLIILLQDTKTLKLFKRDRQLLSTLESFLKKNQISTNSLGRSTMASNSTTTTTGNIHRQSSISSLTNFKTINNSKRFFVDENSITTLSYKLSKLIF